MSFEEYESKKRGKAFKIMASTIGVLAFLGAYNFFEKSNPNETTQSKIARETVAQDLIVNREIKGLKETVYANIDGSELKIIDPIIITISTGNTYVGGFDHIIDINNLNMFQIAENLKVVQVNSASNANEINLRVNSSGALVNASNQLGAVISQ